MPKVTKEKIYTYKFSFIYPMYVDKAVKKGRTKADVDQIIFWLTGYDKKSLASQLKKEVDLETFYKEAPKMNPKRKLITGKVCGVQVEEVEDKIIRRMRYLDKLIDELARGKKMESILRKPKQQKKI